MKCFLLAFVILKASWFNSCNIFVSWVLKRIWLRRSLVFSLDGSPMHFNGNDVKSSISAASLNLRIDRISTYFSQNPTWEKPKQLYFLANGADGKQCSVEFSWLDVSINISKYTLVIINEGNSDLTVVRKIICLMVVWVMSVV